MDNQTILYAFGLTLFAGLSTGVGGLLAFFTKKTNTKVLSLSLGFSAGVMLYISFMDILPISLADLSAIYEPQTAHLYTVLSFFGGILFIALIDFLIPQRDNPHEIHKVEEMSKEHKLRRIGMFTALSIAIHNFPEGMAVFSSSLNDITMAIPIAIAIAIHNIPEGIAVSIPIYQATGNKKLAFQLSILSGMAEPLGAILAYFVLAPYWSPTLNGIIMAAVAGIMVYISLDELLPSAEEYGEHHLAIIGLISGMAVMAGSILLMA